MERKSRSKKGPEVSGKGLPEEKNTEERKPSWFHLVEFLKGAAQRIPSVFSGLGRKVRRAYTQILRPEGDVSPIDDIRAAFSHIPLRKGGLGYVIFGLILTVYLLSGLYTVKPGEEAVARIFGREVRGQITEGLHYHLPWPFEAVEKVNVMEIRRLDLGVQLSDEPLLFPRQGSSSASVEEHGAHAGHGASSMTSGKSAEPRSGAASAKNQFLTGDENILEIKMNIQYGVKDASDYLFNLRSPDFLVPYAARAAVTEIFGRMLVDDLLTVAKSQLQKMIALKVQKMLDGYGAGLYIVHVNLQEVNPPKGVAQAFRDVASAKEKREETINKAQGYWNTVIPEARGEAHKTISNAEGYREEVINLARGDADKFSTMLAEYRRAKSVTEFRLYLETIEKILAKAKKFVVDSKKEQVNIKFVK
jgi:membrane protease subunit HflK